MAIRNTAATGDTNDRSVALSKFLGTRNHYSFSKRTA